MSQIDLFEKTTSGISEISVTKVLHGLPSSLTISGDLILVATPRKTISNKSEGSSVSKLMEDVNKTSSRDSPASIETLIQSPTTRHHSYKSTQWSSWVPPETTALHSHLFLSSPSASRLASDTSANKYMSMSVAATADTRPVFDYYTSFVEHVNPQKRD